MPKATYRRKGLFGFNISDKSPSWHDSETAGDKPSGRNRNQASPPSSNTSTKLGKQEVTWGVSSPSLPPSRRRHTNLSQTVPPTENHAPKYRSRRGRSVCHTRYLKVWSSARAVHALNCRAIFPTPSPSLFNIHYSIHLKHQFWMESFTWEEWIL